jgi:hypothetical protein
MKYAHQIHTVWQACRNKATYKGGGGHEDALKQDHMDFWHKRYLLGGIAMQENSKMYLTMWKI